MLRSRHAQGPARQIPARFPTTTVRFALLRRVADMSALDRLRTLIIGAYTAQVAAADPAE